MSEPTTEYVIGKREGGKRLDHYLHERIPSLSRNRIQQMIRDRVSLSWGVNARPSTPVRAGGLVTIGYVPLAETLLEIDLPILDTGTGWLAVNKPSGIVVHPVNKVRENSLIRMLRRQEGREGLRLVHRLDRETTGVLIVAEDSDTARALSQAFIEGEVHKEYLALVDGVIESDSGRIELPIGRDEHSAIYTKQAAGVGQSCLTEWSVERRYESRTLVRLFPRTGRRHQLRVHMTAIGHPILGDAMYGQSEAIYLDLVSGDGDLRRRAGGPQRQLLHCARMVFPDPAAGGRLEVTAALPEDFGCAGTA
jgi:23S rRNA pseudouridine1911/1915/1917 synthase